MSLLAPLRRVVRARRYRVFLDCMAEWAPRMVFDRDAQGPVVQVVAHDVVLGGVDSTPRDIAMYDALAGLLPAGIEPWNFRLARDVVTRFVFPHMRPDLKPGGHSGAAGLDGFHGQHKDAIADLADPHARQQLMQAFAPKPGDVVLDCGSFLGFGALRMVADAPGGQVIAVEASRACFARLESNVARNGANAIVPRHAAIWSTEETRALNVTAAQANSLIAEIQESHRAEPTPTATVDGLVREHGLQRLDMLSLTLNGAEFEALEGAATTLRDLRPRVRAAGWYRRDGRLIADIVRPVLQRAGYTVHVGPHGNVLALPVVSR